MKRVNPPAAYMLHAGDTPTGCRSLVLPGLCLLNRAHLLKEAFSGGPEAYPRSLAREIGGDAATRVTMLLSRSQTPNRPQATCWQHWNWADPNLRLKADRRSA